MSGLWPGLGLRKLAMGCRADAQGIPVRRARQLGKDGAEQLARPVTFPRRRHRHERVLNWLRGKTEPPWGKIRRGGWTEGVTYKIKKSNSREVQAGSKDKLVQIRLKKEHLSALEKTRISIEGVEDLTRVPPQIRKRQSGEMAR